jgi:ARG and Rhodanese-Phosphatase-superfamily-associated Protein domain
MGAPSWPRARFPPDPIPDSGVYYFITLRSIGSGYPLQEIWRHAFQDRTSACGTGAVFNGEVVSADVYASSALLQKLARKLLESYATEAILAHQTKMRAAVPGQEAVLAFLSNPASGSSKLERVGSSMQQRTVEGDTTVLYEYVYQEPDRNGKAAPVKLVHQNYLRKQ